MARGGAKEPRAERVLRGVCVGAVVLSLMLGVFVIPIQFIDGRLTRMVEAIESSDPAPHPALTLRQRVEEDRYGYGVDELLATYRGDGGEVRTARLHYYGQLRVVREQEGWHEMPVGAGAEIHLTPDGRDGFLAEDYRERLRNEDDVLYRVADAWIAGWAGLGLVALGARSALRLRRGVVGTRGAVLPAVLYGVGAVALVAVGWAVSFPLGDGF
ncbi:hypothetical protein DQ244_01210 [Blastococcus sp. TBT05-19]|uniref:hypothetical protein n=1 Tax=Blastococcus sp. TBT05-19 TaxID=2250581 RepID=UPI000DE8C6C4|nr:hypothetical protein [Blastococcus sp. TBT05-19]RBY94019.1 hypothetical protein DQ244_01210 [Blastococcus sp. TBT05-19]